MKPTKSFVIPAAIVVLATIFLFKFLRFLVFAQLLQSLLAIATATPVVTIAVFFITTASLGMAIARIVATN